MIRVELQQMLTILVDLANSKGTQTGRPRVMVSTNSGIEVAKEDEVFAAVDVLDDVIQVGVELIFCLRCRGQGWGIGTNECNWSFREAGVSSPGCKPGQGSVEDQLLPKRRWLIQQSVRADTVWDQCDRRSCQSGCMRPQTAYGTPAPDFSSRFTPEAFP
ncbi:hypothetical protein SRHO_G00076670 [Serrasalmus rhombeus]